VIENGRLVARLPEIAAQFHAPGQRQLGFVRRHHLQRLPDRRRGSWPTWWPRWRSASAQAQGPGRARPELIGGIRVVVGDEVLDTSVKARLEQMKVALR
jgi:F-type H+-transporting ATPase subunit delta